MDFQPRDNWVNFGGETNGKNKKPKKRKYLVERL
jgi:hypothetical protein